MLTGSSTDADPDIRFARAPNRKALAHMATHVERIAALLQEHAPFVYCCACLARELNLEDKDVRNSVQRLLIEPEYIVRRLACSQCQGDETVVRFV